MNIKRKFSETPGPTAAPAATAGTAMGIQRKAAISSETNPLEDEVDEKADRRVMRMPESPFVQRKCKDCQDKENQTLQRKPATGGTTPFIQAKGNGEGTASDAVTQQIQSTRGGGQPMQEPVRRFMENGFGADFSSVRIHNDGNAGQLSHTLNARAFTVGNDIYFNEGYYSPGSTEGKHLLAHELTHTLQQGSGDAGVQRSTKDKHCRVHAYDNSDPKDKAVIAERSGWDKFWGNYDPSIIGVSSVDDMVTKTNAYINDKNNDCQCVSSLEINGHGTDGYQSVGNGANYVNDDKALVHDSTQAQLDKLKNIKFCDKGMLMLLGCHVGKGLGRTLEKRISNALPGILIGGAEHFTFGTGMDGKQVVRDEADVKKGGHSVDTDKGTPFLKSLNVRWYFTTRDGVEYTRGSDNTAADLDMDVKTAGKVKVVTPDGKSIKIK